MKNRKSYYWLMLAVCSLLLAALLVGGALAQPAAPYQVEAGRLSAGGYQLASARWQVSGSASGGVYNLLAAADPEAAAAGCCCLYMPCITR